MKSEQQIRELIAHISADDRMGYESALVQVNAPLALIQMELEARKSALEWVVGECKNGGGSAGEVRP